jgi:nucleotide-binding universal stress UspA family protein
VTAQHFLVPTDFSPYADQALAEAIDLAHAVNAQITLLHVMQLMPLTVGDVPPEYFSDYLEAIEIEAQRHMQASLTRIYQAGLQADSAITQGIPFQAIVEMAGEKKADLIIMGTQGRTGLPHLLIGSVAEKVVRLAPCPVLVARQKQAAPSA